VLRESYALLAYLPINIASCGWYLFYLNIEVGRYLFTYDVQKRNANLKLYHMHERLALRQPSVTLASCQLSFCGTVR
jgi:hypothetical protein